MKIIVQVNTDNLSKIEHIKKCLEEHIVIIPYGDMIRISIIKDNGDVIKL